MLSGGPMASRFVRQNETKIVRENEWIERAASLCAAKYTSHLRSDQRFVALSRSIPGKRACGSRHLEHVQGSAQRQSVRRLESERRTQNDHLRRFTAGQRRADCFNSGRLERG